MKTFRLCVTRDISESAIIHIKAETRQEAEIKAYDNQRDYTYKVDDYVGETYVISCVEVEEAAPRNKYPDLSTEGEN